tara:strand:- start:132 stop:551 length:420 start_codon:yes stop_codon:yes gene_type:complete
MDGFLFLLSFISGGVVLTVAYIYHLTTKTKEKQDRLIGLQQNLQTIQNNQFSGYESQLKSVYDQMEKVEGEMKNDGYANLNVIRKEYKTLKVTVEQLSKELSKERSLNGERINRCMGDIQRLTGELNALKEDPNVINRY